MNLYYYLHSTDIRIAKYRKVEAGEYTDKIRKRMLKINKLVSEWMKFAYDRIKTTYTIHGAHCNITYGAIHQLAEDLLKIA